MENVELRPEEPADRRDIYTVTADAFRGRPYADGDEQDVIERLRDQGALSLSLVATLAGKVVGHVAFSPALSADGSGPWYALGPVSVTPDLQGRSIGAQLIRAGLDDISDRGALGCILTGNPDYYRRFGFEVTPEHAPLREPGEFFMLKRPSGGCPCRHFSMKNSPGSRGGACSGVTSNPKRR